MVLPRAPGTSRARTRAPKPDGLSTPVLIGLTGGIGAGKSEALAAFARRGAAAISTDDVVHELLRTDEVRSLLVERWGEDVAPSGEVDRARVAEVVFSRPEELAWLEEVLHPRVAERLVAWRRDLPPGTKAAVAEVPLLFEAGMEGAFDAVVSVVADDALRESRAAGRELAVLGGRSDRQLSQEEKSSRATHVIRNDGTLADLEASVAELMDFLTGDEAGR
jgi:dephospho-CoA kinase